MSSLSLGLNDEHDYVDEYEEMLFFFFFDITVDPGIWKHEYGLKCCFQFPK
jgi:hypothetical protein